MTSGLDFAGDPGSGKPTPRERVLGEGPVLVWDLTEEA